ncbi:CotD family spore coat protein [Halobacillus yeomjeoni]|uniref:CotD family spore coat protein n=1 Tax=Halobacillus yeomjeoni TaxID=311194 RepID=UPI001CD27415|nr:CotD family spore coat protein [Halobacillus yeomjeoni]MCA0983064.1 CotD family spore coat protein [Halobacillus yeomjeoni]
MHHKSMHGQCGPAQNRRPIVCPVQNCAIDNYFVENQDYIHPTHTLIRNHHIMNNYHYFPNMASEANDFQTQDYAYPQGSSPDYNWMEFMSPQEMGQFGAGQPSGPGEQVAGVQSPMMPQGQMGGGQMPMMPQGQMGGGQMPMMPQGQMGGGQMPMMPQGQMGGGQMPMMPQGQMGGGQMPMMPYGKGPAPYGQTGKGKGKGQMGDYGGQMCPCPE